MERERSELAEAVKRRQAAAMERHGVITGSYDESFKVYEQGWARIRAGDLRQDIVESVATPAQVAKMMRKAGVEAQLSVIKKDLEFGPEDEELVRFFEGAKQIIRESKGTNEGDQEGVMWNHASGTQTDPYAAFDAWKVRDQPGAASEVTAPPPPPKKKGGAGPRASSESEKGAVADTKRKSAAAEARAEKAQTARGLDKLEGVWKLAWAVKGAGRRGVGEQMRRIGEAEAALSGLTTDEDMRGLDAEFEALQTELASMAAELERSAEPEQSAVLAGAPEVSPDTGPTARRFTAQEKGKGKALPPPAVPPAVAAAIAKQENRLNRFLHAPPTTTAGLLRSLRSFVVTDHELGGAEVLNEVGVAFYAAWKDRVGDMGLSLAEMEPKALAIMEDVIAGRPTAPDEAALPVTAPAPAPGRGSARGSSSAKGAASAPPPGRGSARGSSSAKGTTSAPPPGRGSARGSSSAGGTGPQPPPSAPPTVPLPPGVLGVGGALRGPASWSAGVLGSTSSMAPVWENVEIRMRAPRRKATTAKKGGPSSRRPRPPKKASRTSRK